MTPRQPVERDFNARCQFQLKHHWLGKNEQQQINLSPFLVMRERVFLLPEYELKFYE